MWGATVRDGRRLGAFLVDFHHCLVNHFRGKQGAGAEGGQLCFFIKKVTDAQLDQRLCEETLLFRKQVRYVADSSMAERRATKLIVDKPASGRPPMCARF